MLLGWKGGKRSQKYINYFTNVISMSYMHSYALSPALCINTNVEVEMQTFCDIIHIFEMQNPMPKEWFPNS